MKAKVYFSEQITPEKVVELYKAVGLELPGKVAVKVHSGEPGNQNFLTPEFWQPMVEAVHGTIVECNTAYPGERNTTDAHRRTMIKHGWSKLFDVDILDAEGPDLELPIPNGKRIQKNLVGKNIKNYDSMLVLSHFKGHPMGGFGGALKQLSIGCASSAGKANVCKTKHLTNTRSSGSDDALRLIPVSKLSLEGCLEFLAQDELLEVTPENLRIRKQILNHDQRMKAKSKLK